MYCQSLLLLITLLLFTIIVIIQHHLQVPYSINPLPIKDLGKHRIIDCSLGSTHSAFLTETGLVYTFGRNNHGQLGSGNALPREMAVVVKGLKNKPIVRFYFYIIVILHVYIHVLECH